MSSTFYMRNKCFLSCIFDVIFDMRNKCIQNNIKTPCFFLFVFKMSVSKPKRQHTDRTLKEKIEILGKLDCGLKAVDVCKRFNISQSTLSTWKKQRGKINEMMDAGKVLNQKRNCKSFLPQVERALYLWFCEMRSKLHAPPHKSIVACSEGYIVSIFIIFNIFDMHII